MAIKLIAIYRKPADEVAFNEHYEQVHTPLVRNIPGLQFLRVNRVSKRLMGEDHPYIIAEMVYPDQATFDAAMRSEENRASGKDLMSFASGLVSLVVAED